jgi:hypothetical protein
VCSKLSDVTLTAKAPVDIAAIDTARSVFLNIFNP